MSMTPEFLKWFANTVPLTAKMARAGEADAARTRDIAWSGWQTSREALRKEREGQVLCELELFENLRDAASTEAEGHRQCKATYRPLRQEHLDSVVKKCDDLLAAMSEDAAQ